MAGTVPSSGGAAYTCGGWEGVPWRPYGGECSPIAVGDGLLPTDDGGAFRAVVVEPEQPGSLGVNPGAVVLGCEQHMQHLVMAVSAHCRGVDAAQAVVQGGMHYHLVAVGVVEHQ